MGEEEQPNLSHLSDEEREILADIKETLDDQQLQFSYWYHKANLAATEVEIAKRKAERYDKEITATKQLIESFHTPENNKEQ